VLSSIECPFEFYNFIVQTFSPTIKEKREKREKKERKMEKRESWRKRASVPLVDPTPLVRIALNKGELKNQGEVLWGSLMSTAV